jgi:hypothetical protein
MPGESIERRGMRWEAHQRRGIRRGEQKLGGGRGGVALSPASICPHKTRPNAGVRYYAWRARWAGARCVRSPPPLVEAAGLRAQDPHQRMSSFPVSSALGEGKTEGALSSAGNAHRRGHPPTARQLFSGATLARATRPSPVPVEAAPPDLHAPGSKKTLDVDGAKYCQRSTPAAKPKLRQIGIGCGAHTARCQRVCRPRPTRGAWGVHMAQCSPAILQQKRRRELFFIGGLGDSLAPREGICSFFLQIGPPRQSTASSLRPCQSVSLGWLGRQLARRKSLR